MKPQFIFNLLIIGILAISCNNTNQQENKNESTQKVFKPGTLNERIPCAQNPVYSYTLYLPSYYSPEKLYPAIVVFDAHARGKMAARRFAEASEKFGYIIFASDNAKNGFEKIDDVVNALFTDVFAFKGIDKKRVYTAGFSGGAKVASSTAIYKGGIKGVIACAGGMPKVGQELSTSFDYVSMVGLNDFNYHELKTLDKALTENGFTNEFFTFDGSHEWPSQTDLSRAVEWLELMAMKQKLIPVNDNFVRNYLNTYADSINKCLLTGKEYKAWQLYTILLKDLDGFYDVSDFKKSFEALLKNPALNNSIKADEKIITGEQNKQQDLLEMFKSGNYNTIKTEIGKLNKEALDKDELKLHSAKRLLGFIGMLCYMYTENAVNSQNVQAYKGTIEIYELVDPKNPDKEFYKACQAMMENNPDKALDYLKKAISFGYYDADRLQQIGYFEQLRTKPEFDLIVKQAMENFNNQK
ncbi:MAG: hypothetical protein U0W24_17420 [Bacteroidales bacterium]